MIKLKFVKIKKIIIIFFLNFFFFNTLFAASEIMTLMCDNEEGQKETFKIGNYRIESLSHKFIENIYIDNNILTTKSEKYKMTLKLKKKITERVSLKIDLNGFTAELTSQIFNDKKGDYIDKKYFDRCYIR